MNFIDFKNIHKGETIIVCGLGESLNAFTNPEDFITIGVNDIGRKFHPTYLLNVNNKSQYKGDRFSWIENTEAKYIFTHRPTEQGAGTRAPIVKFEIDRNPGGIEIVESRLPHFRCSPYMAVALAGFMGGCRVGLIGVDFTDNHFWTNDGTHRLVNELSRINEQFGKLAVHLNSLGCAVYNLSPISRITSLPKASLESWKPEKRSARNTLPFTQSSLTM